MRGKFKTAFTFPVAVLLFMGLMQECSLSHVARKSSVFETKSAVSCPVDVESIGKAVSGVNTVTLQNH